MLPVIVNGAAGTAGGSADDLARLFAEAGCEARIVQAPPGVDLHTLVADLAREKPEAIVAAGGDGTVSAVASGVAGTGVALGVLPLGTLNHFAKDLGIPLDLAGAVRAAAQRHAVEVDVGAVNGRVFVNNSSLGLYPHIVRNRESQQRRLGRGKWPALVWATLTSLRRSPFLNVRLHLNGEEQQLTTSFVFIGNNEYTMEGFNVGARERLDGGHLSVYVTRRGSRGRLVMLALRALVGRLRQADDFEAMSARTLVIETRRRRRLHVATDGEVAFMDTPLTYELRPRALRVRVLPPER